MQASFALRPAAASRPLARRTGGSARAPAMRLAPAAVTRSASPPSTLPGLAGSALWGRRCSMASSAAVVPSPLRRTALRAAEDPEAGGMDVESIIGSVGMGLLWAGLIYYATTAPNQTPLRDSYFLEKAIGLGSDDGVKLNQVFISLFNIMGVWPAVYAGLLIPSGRSANKVPAWPFVVGSFAFGAFALLPYMALWQPPAELPAPPTAEDLAEEGVPKGLMQRVLESRINAALILAGAVAMLVQAGTAGGAAWSDFFHLFNESKFTNVMTVDFCTLTALAPFWIYNDAQARGYKNTALLPLFCLVPAAGPAAWLLARPRNFTF